MKTGISSVLLGYFVPFLKTVLNNRSTLPMLGSVRITMTDSGHISLFATDLDREIRIHTGDPSVGRTIFDACIESDALFKAVTAAKRSGMVLEVDGSEASIRYNADGVDIEREASAYPAAEMDGAEAAYHKKIDTGWLPVGPEFLNGYQIVAPCISNDETRYVLKGCFLDYESKLWVATDGRRLASIVTKLPSLPAKVFKHLPANRPGFIIPDAKFLRSKLPVGRDLLVRFGGSSLERIQEPLAYFSTRMDYGPFLIDFTTRLIDGNFPNFQQVIPTQKTCSLSIPDIASKIGAFKVDDKHKGVNMEIRGHKVTFRHRKSSFSVDSAIEGPAPEEWIICVDQKFFMYPLSTGMLTFDLIDEQSPLVFRSEDRTYVLMPMRVAG